MLCYLNGQILPVHQASVSVSDRGYLLGEGLFETMRVSSGTVSFLDRHLGRLGRGAELIGLPLPPTADLYEAVRAICRANSLEQGSIRLTVSAHPGSPEGDKIGTRAVLSNGAMAGNGGITVLVTAREGVPYPEQMFETGLRVVTVGIRLDERSPLCHVKSLSRLLYTLAGREAGARGADEGLMLNGRAEIAECTRSNFFWVKRSQLFTPAVECGPLPGIAREVTLEEAHRVGLQPREVRCGPESICEADECFLSNSLMEVMPVAEIDGIRVGGESRGEIWRLLRQAYQAKARED